MYELTWGELCKWLSYMRQEPFGETRADLRIGALASVIARANIDSKKHPNCDPTAYRVGLTGDGEYIFMFYDDSQVTSPATREYTAEEWEDFKSSFKAWGKSTGSGSGGD